MKKLCLLFTTFIFCSFLWASEAHMSLTITPDKTSLSTTFSDKGLCYSVNIGQSNDVLTAKAPPTFSLNSNDWYLGEIRTAGLFSYVLDPTEKPFNPATTKAFQKVVSPSLKPSFSGVAVSMKNFDFATLSPVFSPTSPSGFYMDYHSNHFYAALLQINYHKKEQNKFLVDWENIVSSGENLFGILGFNDGFSYEKIKINLSSFYQSQFRNSFGLTGTGGWNMAVSASKFSFESFRRISNTASDSPINSIGYSLGLFNMTFGYILRTYQNPVYGGQSQKKEAEYTCGFKNEYLNFTTTSTMSLDKDTGKSANTEIDLDLKKNKTELGLSLGLNRLEDSDISVNYLDFSLDINDSKFGVKGAKYSVLLTLNECLYFKKQLVNVKVSINQDHEYTLSAKMFI